jgi:hypothetical protein
MMRNEKNRKKKMENEEQLFSAAENVPKPLLVP